MAETIVQDLDEDGTPDFLDADDDGDGVSDSDEGIAGTDGQDAGSFLFLQIEGTVTQEVRKLMFPSVTGRIYFIRSRTNLFVGRWSPASTNLSGDGTMLVVEDTNTNVRTYYQVGVEQTPP